MYDDFVKEIDDLRCENSSLNYKLSKKETQQKEFRKYLEDYQDGASRSLDSYDCGINDCLGDVLSKYKEIIGDDK